MKNKLSKYSNHELTQELRSRKIALAVWTVEDVMMQAEERGIEITESEAENVIGLLDSKQDANYGITWDTIDTFIDEVVEEN